MQRGKEEGFKSDQMIEKLQGRGIAKIRAIYVGQNEIHSCHVSCMLHMLNASKFRF